jgi:four helix bundle protein
MQNTLLEKNPILKLSFDFSLMVINYCQLLDENKKYIISKQVLRAGTSIGANAMEAPKEADETQYWLLLCNYAQSYPDCKDLIFKLEEVQKVLNKILGTVKRKNPISYFFSLFIF